MKRSLLSALAVGLFITANVMAQVPSYVPTNGLVGWWPFNGNANDESGNGNNGTVNGATLTTDRNGEASKAYSFDGIDDFIEIPNSSSLSNPNLTIGFWINSNSVVFQQVLYKVSFNTAQNEEYSIPINLNNQNEINLDLKNNSCSPGIGWVSFNNSAVLSNWKHVIFTHDGSITRFFLDGILINSQNANFNIANCPGGSLILGIAWNLQHPLNGLLDDIGIWNRALTQQEITNLHNSCSASTIIAQPTNQTVNPTNSAQFIVNTSTGSSFQWQTDLGFGFQNLSNAGQYSGASNDTLVVSSVSGSNNNQQFRCIVSNAGCVDTSDIAILTVSTVGIEEIMSQTKFTLYPNPTQTSFEIQTNLVYAKIEVRDMQGRIVKTENTGKIINIASLQKGTYLVKLMDEKSKVIAIQRIIKE